MSKFSFNAALLRLENKLCRGVRRVKHIIKKPLAHSPISVLNNDVLLHIFYIHRLHIELEPQHDSGDDRCEVGYLFWDCQRWWYKLAHVSRRWRHVIFSAPSLLDLHLVCTNGVPVADMLAHYPPLPLTIFYWLDDYTMFEEDVNGALLALSHRDRVRRIALRMLNSQLRKLFVAMNGEFPILESLNIDSTIIPDVTLPGKFRAPNLSHVTLTRVALPIQCALLTTTALVSLRLRDIPGSGCFPPSYMLASLSLMPQLEALWIIFDYPVRSRDTALATISHVTLPSLREFRFWGVEDYLEGLCARMTAPVLSVLHVRFSNLHTFAVPHLLSFMQTSENFQFHAVKLIWGVDHIRLQGDPRPSTCNNPLNLLIWCRHLDGQISSPIHILHALSSVLSVAEKVTLIVNRDELSQSHDVVSRTEWRGLLRPLRNVRVLRVVTDIGGCGLGHSIRTAYGEQPLDLLPYLEEISYSGSDDENAFMPFINRREAVGRPVRLTLLSR